MWHLLIPLFVSANTTGADAVVFREWRSTTFHAFVNIEIPEKTKARLRQGIDCGVPFWIDTADNTLLSFRFRIEDTSNCKFRGYNEYLPSSYPLFRFINYEIIYSIDSPALKQYEQDSKVFRHLLLLYDDTLVIRSVQGIPESDLRAQWVNRYELIQSDTSVSFDKGLIRDPVRLQKIIHDVYRMDCCYLSNPDTNCIPFGNVLSGCEARAQQIARYLDTTGFKYVLVDLYDTTGLKTFIQRYQRTIQWGHHIAAAVLYRSLQNYIILDPTVFNFDSTELSVMYPDFKELSRENWEAKFAPYSTANDNVIETYVCSPPYFVCRGESMYRTEEQIQRSRRRGIDKLKYICTCYTDFPDYFE